ncbi:uncharacterized protein CTRU02_201704 [Colletotrichum truncatum]|uniref:Uncharacterized protein n=1 Tax=Colletotrichum truncatum TaxID=5467 RepID=A0ACC3ZI57_COLTU|nr:uncharacterized protein CTRU02_11590 [Colletotrichum truncatum]KAF6785605.1 hypothetical protein CTRU02_11590 [Colletotrichum truncatum]
MWLLGTHLAFTVNRLPSTSVDATAAPRPLRLPESVGHRLMRLHRVMAVRCFLRRIRKHA